MVIGPERDISHAIECADSRDVLGEPEYPKARSAFGYYGAKNKVAAKIIKLLPPHNCWVDLFCGSASITLAKKPAPIEIINDIDQEIINVFQQLRHRPSKLIKSIELTPYARDELRKARENSIPPNDLERARVFLVTAMMSINGVLAGSKGGFSYSNSYSRSGKEARVNRWTNFPERLKEVSKRLRNIRIENSDAINLLEKFSNRPATLVYIDPPYLADRTSGYVHDARNESFHIELLNACNKAKCMILISSYENPVYGNILTSLRGWEKKVINTHTSGACGKRFDRNEVVWMNRVAIKALDTKCVPIRLSKKEKTANKINPIRGRRY